VINISAVRAAQWHQDPYPWVSIDDLLPAGLLDELIRTFPVNGFMSDESSPNHKRSQLTRTLAVRSSDELLQRDRALPDPWNALIDDLLGLDYATAMSEAAGVDLSRSSVAIAIWRMPTGGFNATHGTSRNKIVSQLTYFSPAWGLDWGGDFQVRANDDNRTVVESLPPLPGTSVAFRATDRSWHSVAPVTRSERRSLSVHYFTPDAELSWFLSR
jgi:hypothetical protein